MRRTATLLLALLVTTGCSRASKETPTAAPSGTAPRATPPPEAAPAAFFSAPIAGARAGKGAVVAVGLVVSTSAIVATRIEADGHVAWTREVLRGVRWSSDVELRAFGVSSGTIVVWRGTRDGHFVRQAVLLSPGGDVVGEPIEIGPLSCATDDGLAWSQASDAGGAFPRLRVWGAAAHVEDGPELGGDLALACSAHRAYAIAENDEDDHAQIASLGSGAPRGVMAKVASRDLGSGEERDLLPFADGDALGFVRINTSGAVRVSELRDGKLVTAAHDAGSVKTEDDVVAVDADSAAAYVVSTHDESEEACKTAHGGDRVSALRVPRAPHDADPSTTVEIAPPACGVGIGPFWTNGLGSSLVVAWPERSSRRDGGPVTALVHRVLDGAPRAASTRIVVDADAIADAGCDESKCYAVILARDGHSTAMQPEPIKVISYP